MVRIINFSILISHFYIYIFILFISIYVKDKVLGASSSSIFDIQPITMAMLLAGIF